VEALIHARALMKQRLFHPGRTELPNELAELGWPGDQMMWEALCAAFEEAHADYYQIDRDPNSPQLTSSFGTRNSLESACTLSSN
jgi:hypothetical protein